VAGAADRVPDPAGRERPPPIPARPPSSLPAPRSGGDTLSPVPGELPDHAPILFYLCPCRREGQLMG